MIPPTQRLILLRVRTELTLSLSPNHRTARHLMMLAIAKLRLDPKSPTEIDNFSPDFEITNFDRVFSLPKKVISLQLHAKNSLELVHFSIMPELPEVERAVGVINTFGSGRRIEKVDTVEDTIVFSGITHDEFAKAITGRKIKNVGRYGKCFYLELDGEGKMPVFHFGMTGMVQVKGELPTYYKEGPKSTSTEWPPRFVKFILHLTDDASNSTAELAFMDARRLGRIRLRASPLTELPISELGFDPILSMPTLDQFIPLVLKRSCPIKALLLDQSFSAGVGNWVADEILYNARVHPEQRCDTLSSEQLTVLHHQTQSVCKIAVAANADDSKFPEHWLFKHRWGRGKKEKHTLKLPSGQPATIKWLTVGGRTSAFVTQLQQLPYTSTPTRNKRPQRLKQKSQPTEDNSGSDLTTLTYSDTDSEAVSKGKRKALLQRSEVTPVTRRKISHRAGTHTRTGGN